MLDASRRDRRKCHIKSERKRVKRSFEKREGSLRTSLSHRHEKDRFNGKNVKEDMVRMTCDEILKATANPFPKLHFYARVEPRKAVVDTFRKENEQLWTDEKTWDVHNGTEPTRTLGGDNNPNSNFCESSERAHQTRKSAKGSEQKNSNLGRESSDNTAPQNGEAFAGSKQKRALCTNGRDLEESIRSMNVLEINNRATNLKRHADKLEKCIQKAIFYLESVCYFALQAELLKDVCIPLEEQCGFRTNGEKILQETSDLLKFNHALVHFLKGEAHSASNAIFEKLDYLIQLATSFLYHQRWRIGLSDITSLSRSLTSMCEQSRSQTPVNTGGSPGASLRSASTSGISSPGCTSGPELRTACFNFVRIVNRSIYAEINFANAINLTQVSSRVKDLHERLERQYRPVNYASVALSCYTYILMGLKDVKRDCLMY